MTSPPSPPNRRRRRVVVAIAVLALMSAVSWWYWPRGDARFVGRWALSRPDGRYIHTWDLSRNGGGWVRNVYSGRSTPISWNASGDKLRLGFGSPGFANAVFQANTFLHSVAGWHPWIITGEQWGIRQVDADAIELFPPGAPAPPYRLTRILE